MRSSAFFRPGCIAALILILSLTISCKKNELSGVYIPTGPQPAEPVGITYYYPYYGIPGDTITIIGKNLKTTKYISFDGIPATSYRVIQDTLKAVLGPFSGDSSIVRRGTLEIQTDSNGNLIENDGGEFLFYPSRIEGFVASWQLFQKFNIWLYNTFDELFFLLISTGNLTHLKRVLAFRKVLQGIALN